MIQILWHISWLHIFCDLCLFIAVTLHLHTLSLGIQLHLYHHIRGVNYPIIIALK